MQTVMDIWISAEPYKDLIIIGLTVLTVVMTIMIIILTRQQTAYSKMQVDIGQKQIELGEKQISIVDKDNYNLTQNIKVYKGRTSAIAVLSEILRRAQKDDVVFGQCNLCTYYPDDFYKELPLAIARGAYIDIIVRKNSDSEKFLDYMSSLTGLSPDHVQMFYTNEDYIRILGIKEKEVLVALTYKDDFIGIHFTDSAMTDYLQVAFDEIKKHSENLKR